MKPTPPLLRDRGATLTAEHASASSCVCRVISTLVTHYIPVDSSTPATLPTPRLQRLLYTESPPRLTRLRWKDVNAFSRRTFARSETLALAALIAVCVVVALIAIWTLRTIKRERSARVAAERAAAQSHRLAQSNAALGHAGTSTDAMETAIHEPLHWLRAARRRVLSAVRRSPASHGRVAPSDTA